ncbi:MAG: WcaF family extracellular polysaccharide biosynthesis acetyltransferase [Flavobacteriales bacterium]
MQKATTDLSTFNNSDYDPGSKLKRIVWYYINAVFMRSRWLPMYGFKRFLLRAFGATIGKDVVIKPAVNIKYPWKLTIGDYAWIGEEVWIDNLSQVTIGNHCCISQGALLLCGNHNYKKVSFDLISRPITLEDGCWIGAKATVTGGVVCKSHSLLAVNSATSVNLDAYTIYRGNPAVAVKERKIS